MNEKHYKEKLSSFVNHELPNDERQAIDEEELLNAIDAATVQMLISNLNAKTDNF